MLVVKMIIKATSANKGMVINPSQFIYSPEQGTRPHEGAELEMKETFCNK
jgi:hypothetical protein